MNFIKKHITAIIVTLVCLTLLVLAAFAVYRMFYPSNDKSVHGDRGVGLVSVTDADLATVAEKIYATKNVNKVTHNISSSKTAIKFFVDVKSDVKIKKAQELEKVVLENFSAEIIDSYEISIYLTQKEGEMIEYPATGQKAKESKKFNWVLNKEVSSSEE